jgi:hypothetical protein
MSEDSAQQIETAAVLTAYGFNAKKDVLAQLLALIRLGRILKIKRRR